MEIIKRKMKDIAVYGAGGLGREIACVINEINEKTPIWNFLGFFDDGIEKGTKIDYGIILGGIDELNNWDKDISIVIGIGSPKIVFNIVNGIKNKFVSFPNIFSHDIKFVDQKSLKIGRGNFINFKGNISCNVTIGNFNTIGALSTLGHDCIIGDYNTIMPSVQICGYVEIGNRNFFGISSTVLQMNKVGNGVTLGAGSILMKNAEDGITYFGNPARPIIKK